MVWFQCEACGDELKKPKLPNHFRQCSAYKLSCIDCGESFDQQSAQSHSQCITEAEKYGPKGLSISKATPAKGKPNKPDVDTSVGLSLRPPWFCSLCNTQATSQQALLIHADGKKHRAKCRAKLYLNTPVPVDAALPNNNHSADINPTIQTQHHNYNGRTSPSHHTTSVLQNDILTLDKTKTDTPDTTPTTNGAEDLPTKSKKACQRFEVKATDNYKHASQHNFKWKKLIASLLKSTPDGALKMKKLQKLVLKSLRESGIAVNDSDLTTTIEHKVNSSSKYKVDGKYVRLAV